MLAAPGKGRFYLRPRLSGRRAGTVFWPVDNPRREQAGGLGRGPRFLQDQFQEKGETLNMSTEGTHSPSQAAAETHGPNLIDQFAEDVELSGLVGEEKNAKVIFLSAVSARLWKPLNVTVQGPSAAGKNYLLGKVAAFIPEEMRVSLTGMTPKALMHGDENEYRHKAIFIAEYEGVAGADFGVRIFQSEQVIEWDYVESSSKGIQKKKRKVNGPAAFIQTTTRPVLHPENETRLLFVQMDESREQTSAILRQQAREARWGGPIEGANLHGRWHDLIRNLKPARVIVPFASELALCFPDTRVRSRRDFPKLLGLIEASAFLHQSGRERDGECIIASPEDYDISKPLFEHAYRSGPDETVARLLEAAHTVKQVNGEFEIADAMQQAGWGHSWAYEVLRRAKDLGCIAEGSKRGFYRVLKGLEHDNLKLSQSVSSFSDIPVEIPCLVT